MRSGLDSVRTASRHILMIQSMLAKMDSLQLPALSRSDIERILCRQIARLVESHLPRYAGHGERTASYALALGEAVGLSRPELHDIELAALLHDIGLLTLPWETTEKDGPLTAEEYALVQSHPRAGAALLDPIPVLRVPALWIAHHHERWDGLGYPYGLRGELIPLGARILAVADTFDLLVSPHWNGRERDRASALSLLHRLAGSQLDPALVALFARIAPTEPALPASCSQRHCADRTFLEAVCAAASTGGGPVPPFPRPHLA